jgi:hypothetical protein
MRYQAALRSDKPQIIAFSRAARNEKGGNTGIVAGAHARQRMRVSESAAWDTHFITL